MYQSKEEKKNWRHIVRKWWDKETEKNMGKENKQKANHKKATLFFGMKSKQTQLLLETKKKRKWMLLLAFTFAVFFHNSAVCFMLSNRRIFMWWTERCHATVIKRANTRSIILHVVSYLLLASYSIYTFCLDETFNYPIDFYSSFRLSTITTVLSIAAVSLSLSIWHCSCDMLTIFRVEKLTFFRQIVCGF